MNKHELQGNVAFVDRGEVLGLFSCNFLLLIVDMLDTTSRQDIKYSKGENNFKLV